MESIITTVAIIIILPVVFELFYLLKAKEEKKYKDKEFLRTRMPKVIQGFFLGFLIFFFVIMVVAAVILIKDKAPISTLIIAIAVVVLFMGLCFFGFCITRFNYEIFDKDKIIIIRCFKRKRVVEFNEICYYSYVPSIISGLIAYDKFGIPLFSSDGFNIGIEQVVDLFKEKNITYVSKDNDFPFNGMKETGEYIKYKKKANLKGCGWVFLGFGLACLFLSAVMFPNIHFEEYQNYAVTGIVKSYKFDKNNESITIELKDDGNVYRVNNIVYKNVSDDFEKQLNADDEILLYVAYADGWGRLNVSQIELNGEIYLDMETAEAAERENFQVGLVMAFVILGISVALLISWLICFIVVKVKYDKSNKRSA